MLREHGAQRPTVFEVLNLVHRMRGTKSKFTYNVPSRSQLVPQLATEPASTTAGALDGLVSYRSSTSSISQSQLPQSSKRTQGFRHAKRSSRRLLPCDADDPQPYHSTMLQRVPRAPYKRRLNANQQSLNSMTQRTSHGRLPVGLCVVTVLVS
jgi:AP2-associated kinase